MLNCYVGFLHWVKQCSKKMKKLLQLLQLHYSVHATCSKVMLYWVFHALSPCSCCCCCSVKCHFVMLAFLLVVKMKTEKTLSKVSRSWNSS